MISETDVINGYLWILGRCPSADEITAYRNLYSESFSDSALDFVRLLIISGEFRNRRGRIAWRMRLEPVDLDRPRTVFMHIEKCGGTTLHAMLVTQFRADLVCPERFDGLPDFTINELGAYDLFSGHFDFCCCRLIPGDNVRIVTMLREPKARLLSLFYFWKAHLPDVVRDCRSLVGIARTCTALEFFSHPFVLKNPSINNGMTGQLIRKTIPTHLSDEAPMMEQEDPILSDPDKALSMAWQNLQSLAGFGILEHYETSRALLNNVLGLAMQPIEPQQVLDDLVVSHSQLIPVEREMLTDELNTLLDALTGIDRPLYERALKVFQSRARAIGL